MGKDCACTLRLPCLVSRSLREVVKQSPLFLLGSVWVAVRRGSGGVLGVYTRSTTPYTTRVRTPLPRYSATVPVALVTHTKRTVGLTRPEPGSSRGVGARRALSHACALAPRFLSQGWTCRGVIQGGLVVSRACAAGLLGPGGQTATAVGLATGTAGACTRPG